MSLKQSKNCLIPKIWFFISKNIYLDFFFKHHKTHERKLKSRYKLAQTVEGTSNCHCFYLNTQNDLATKIILTDINVVGHNI